MKRARLILYLLVFSFAISWSFVQGTDKAQFSTTEAMAHLHHLSVTIGSRPAGMEGELRALDYIAEQFVALGYGVERQNFEFPFFEDRGTTLMVLGDQTEEVGVNAMVYSPPGEIEGELVYVGLGRTEEFNEKEIAGKIALIERGILTFRNKVANAAASGAKAVIVYNNTRGLVRGSLQELGPIPAAMIDRESGKGLVDRLSSGPLRVSLVVDVVSESRTSYNLVARWPGTDQHKVLVGGHYDSVAEGPGANDNASGIAVVMELARIAANTDVGRSTIFAAFGAEELGLYGSRHMASILDESQVEGLSAMINLDMVGVGARMNAGGDRKIVKLARGFAPGVGQTLGSSSRAGGSDHVPFARRGVPVLFLTRPDDANYHTSQDTYENIEPKAIETTGQIAELVLKHLIRVGDEALLFGLSLEPRLEKSL